MSNQYTPDRWVIVKLGEGYKILSGWVGGYLHGDSWRLSSGITDIKRRKGYWEVTNHSGSVYYLYDKREGYTMVSFHTYEKMKRPVTVNIKTLTGSICPLTGCDKPQIPGKSD